MEETTEPKIEKTKENEINSENKMNKEINLKEKPKSFLKAEEYFNRIETRLKKEYEIATEARKKGYDPEEIVNIPIARNMAERVEGLISSVAPHLIGKGIPQRIDELEETYGLQDWRVALLIAEEVTREKFGKFKDIKEAMEIGIRVGFLYNTLGIVSAPLEGFVELAIRKRKDGKEYVAVKYAGPIRGAGGTGAAFSVIVADYVRTKMGYSDYDPTEKEVKRFVTEIHDYHERVTNLQYHPSGEEIKFLVENLKVQIDGDPTETIEVSNHKDIDRIETNIIRGGMCLVIAEGISQKAPKLWKRLSKWGEEFSLKWGFLEGFLELQNRIKARKKTTEKTGEIEKVAPNYTFIKDIVAGRPVLSFPMAIGGFRLRYGRTRFSGYTGFGVSPSTLAVLKKYIAIGTQLKIERPTKGATVTPCDSICGPVVLLEDGEVVEINTEAEAKQIVNKIIKILFLGDILIDFGDFSEFGHCLMPAGYTEECWIKHFEKATVDLFGSLDIEKLSELLGLSTSQIASMIESPLSIKPTAKEAAGISEKLRIPFHPAHTFFWKAISLVDFKRLVDWIDKGKIEDEGINNSKIILPGDEAKDILEMAGIPHKFPASENVVIEKNTSTALIHSLNLFSQDNIKGLKGKIDAEIKILGLDKEENKKTDLDKIESRKEGSDEILRIINETSKIKIEDKVGTFIGARMGRPEKAKMRKLTGSPHMLFPVGEQGGRLRCFQSTLDEGFIKSDFPIYKCEKCNSETIYPVCEKCDTKTKRLYFCNICGFSENEECEKHGLNKTYTKKDLQIKHYFNSALKKIGTSSFPDLIKGVRGTGNKDHTPENLVKGILRAKRNVYVNKDGTIRYDMTELPITHFKPKEIGTSVERIKELGYEKDVHGRELSDENQVIEIFPQDVILPGSEDFMEESAASVLLRVGKFVDDLLIDLYGLEPYYNFKTKDDLIGHLIIGLAPHISAGMIGRIIGFSMTQGCIAHPMWHAALRRDCDGDEAGVMMSLDALINFSRQFLPDRRGGRTMDAPLVLSTRLIPSEVDDQSHGLGIVKGYPISFYEAAKNYKNPWELDIEQIKNRVGTEEEFEPTYFTHPTSDINKGVRHSAYKTIPSMEDKLKGQMALAELIRAADEKKVAELVIEKHFLRDTKGNLRKFSQQQFRCVNCNQKFRRPPLIGKCTKCGGKIIFTISEGSILKYLEPSLSIAEKYNVRPYLKQTLKILKRMTESIFGKEKEKQEGLDKWFG